MLALAQPAWVPEQEPALLGPPAVPRGREKPGTEPEAVEGTMLCHAVGDHAAQLRV